MWRLQVQLNQESTLGPFPPRFPFWPWVGLEERQRQPPALMAPVPASLTLLATIPGQAVIGQSKSHDQLLLPQPCHGDQTEMEQA